MSFIISFKWYSGEVPDEPLLQIREDFLDEVEASFASKKKNWLCAQCKTCHGIIYCFLIQLNVNGDMNGTEVESKIIQILGLHRVRDTCVPLEERPGPLSCKSRCYCQARNIGNNPSGFSKVIRIYEGIHISLLWADNREKQIFLS